MVLPTKLKASVFEWFQLSTSKGPGAIQRWNENQDTLPVGSVELEPKSHFNIFQLSLEMS